MANYQSYCTLDELLKDAENTPGLPEDVLTRFILPASRYVEGEIGAFLPTLETLSLTGDSSPALFVPPLLRVTGNILNDDTTLSATDYLLRASEMSNRPAWRNGPYFRIDADPESTALGNWSSETNSVVIPGAWGLYELVQALGITVASEQSSSAETLVISNGARLSPGMLLKIGDELEFVSGYGTPTSAVTTLTAGLDASQEEISVADGTKINVGEILRIGFERVKVLDISTNDAYVIRGWEKTKKVSHDGSANVDAYRTFSVKRGCNGSTAALHAVATAISQYLVPEDINYLTRQIATLMLKKAQTGYAGRAGNSETGETYYNFEFPREAIARIKSNYRVPLISNYLPGMA